ncbi:uncharacterized protein LOC105789538 [Gossypium raimondii]|uniref:uncharacterized protein LOC105789538 n=1 Tax=Gossypium raimondii TaxID=29730 RepID=UPI00063AAF0F|nr:uncharacterized protein LOC105789538 [Gossypium raimondii]
MSPFEVLYGGKCQSPICWLELIEKKLISPDLVLKAEEKVMVIENHLKISQDRQKAYADKRRKHVSYEVGDKVFLKVSTWKKIIHFGLKRKLNPRFIRPYEIREHKRLVIYRLAFSPKMSKIHNVFHVSMLQRYRPDPNHVVQLEALEVEPNLSYEEEFVCILDRKIKMLRNKEIPLVKVLWKNHKVEKATWERENSMKEQYPHLFEGTKF